MSYCINPSCSKPDDPLNSDRFHCRHCGSSLWVRNGFRAVALLREDDFSKLYELRNDRGQSQVLQVLSIDHPRAIALLQQQAKVLSQLNPDPGVPQVEPDGYFIFHPSNGSEVLHCLAMEKIEGITLEELFWMQQGQPISQDLALDWLRQLVEILDRLHRHLYFHRDLQPENILVRDNGQLALINFASIREVAIAYLAFAQRSLMPESEEIETTRLISPGYTPWEQARGKGVPQSDFFALGRTFVYLLTGKLPTDFPEDPRTGRLIWQHRAQQISPDLIELIDEMMAPLPGDRPHNAAAIQKRLDRFELSDPLLGGAFSSFERFQSSRPNRLVRSYRHFHCIRTWLGQLKKPLLWGGSLLLLGAIAARVHSGDVLNFNLPHIEFGSGQQPLSPSPEDSPPEAPSPTQEH
jgi:serine/threonine protein kinase